MKISKLVVAYVDHGKKHGYASAECILMNHLPQDIPDGKCCDVLESDRLDFYNELNNGSAFQKSDSKEKVESHE